MALLETVMEEPPYEFDESIDPVLQASDHELTHLFDAFVNARLLDEPVTEEMYDGLEAFLGDRYALLFPRLPSEAKSKKFGMLLRGDITDLLRRLGYADEAKPIAATDPREITRQVEELGLNTECDDLFANASKFATNVLKTCVEIEPVEPNQQTELDISSVSSAD